MTDVIKVQRQGVPHLNYMIDISLAAKVQKHIGLFRK